MAKSPRRRSGSSGRGPRKSSSRPPAAKPVKPVKPVKPPTAKPVRPAAAQPVKPPVAKPVQPTRPPTAKPVRPAAAQPVKPARPPAAKPVKPAAAQPVRPAAAAPVKPQAKPAAKSSGRKAARMSEEEIGAGRGGRGGRAPARGGHGGGGMGIGAKVGLISGLVALLIGAGIAMLSTKGGDSTPENAVFLEAGYRSAAQIAAIDSTVWTGGSSKTGGYKKFKRIFSMLFGDEGTDYWDRLEGKVTDKSAYEEMDADEKTEWQALFNKFQETKKKLDKGELGKTSVNTAHLLDRVMRSGRPDVQEPAATVLAAFVTKGRHNIGADWLAQNSSAKRENLKVDPALIQKSGGRGAYIDGQFVQNGNPIDVRFFGMVSVDGRVTGWTAVYDSAAPQGGPNSGAGLGLGLAVIGAILVGAVGAGIAGGHTKNIRGLAGEIDRLGRSGDMNRQLRAQGAEASVVARSVERMVANLELREKHEGADLDEVVSKESKVAEEIHGALIAKNPPRLATYEVETLFKPGFEIGGDHFEYFNIDENHLGVVLLDTNVRGVPAALVISQAKAYVRAFAPKTLSPADVLKRVNASLAGELPPGRHVTALYAVIDTKEGKATLASAGHLPLIVYRHSSGKVFKVNPEGIALGLDKGPVFNGSLQEGDIPIGVGDRIVLYTDGALQIQNELGEEFGEVRFHQAVSREAPKNSQAFVNFVGSAIDQFHLNSPQNDDITISTVKRLK